MLDKIELFKTRIFYENKTYLLASDAAKALGYESTESFIDKNSELIVSMDQIPKLISETDFNWLLSNDAVSLEKLKHLEITKIDILRMKTETHKSMYPLKVMFASEMFKRKALYAGLSTVEEYIEKVDYPSEICGMIKEMQKEEDVIKKAESLENTETEVLGTESEEISYPVCIMHYGAQNGFGGNTTGYLFAMYSTENEGYEILGTCDSLDEEDYDKDDEDDLVDLITCGLINIYLEDEEREPIGSIDMGRLKTVLKNDAYSTIKIIE